MIHRHSPNQAVVILCLATLLVSLLLVGGCASTSPTASEPEPTPPPVATLERVSALLVPHPIQGQEQCGACHTDGMPEDHADREDRTCLVCHDPAPAAHEVSAGSSQEQGQTIWQERANLTCRDCHGFEGDGGFGPALLGTGLGADTFVQRTRSPLSERMPPTAASLDDPNFESSGVWISDEDLLLIYSWLSGYEVEIAAAEEPSAAPLIPHRVEGQEDCLMCHALDRGQPYPDNHEGRGNEMCMGCHKAE